MRFTTKLQLTFFSLLKLKKLSQPPIRILVLCECRSQMRNYNFIFRGSGLVVTSFSSSQAVTKWRDRNNCAKGEAGPQWLQTPSAGRQPWAPGHLGTWAVRISPATQWSSLAPVSRARSKSTKTNLGTLAFLVLLHSIPAINQNGDSPNKHYHQVILLTCWNVYKPICKLRKGIRGKQPFRQRQLPAMETPRRAPDKSITQ